MRTSAILLICLVSIAPQFASPVYGQATRDSAGVLIVENSQPAWSESERIKLAEQPHLVLGNDADSVYIFRQVRGILLLDGGRLAVVDVGSLQLRLFGPEGQFVSRSAIQGMVPGQNFNVFWVRRLPDDTIAIETSFSTVGLYSRTGEFLRTVALPAWTETSPGERPHLIALVNSDLGVAASIRDNRGSHPIGAQWTDSVPLQIVTASSNVRRELGPLPFLEMEQVSTGPMPIWLSSIGVFAAGDDRFYYGFGDRYQIRVYGGDGSLRSIIRRAWAPVAITDDDWEHWVVEWSKLWVRSTGPERDRDIQEVRESPWARQNPAFSQIVVDRIGRLWVRDAHWQDAIAAGSLTDRPAVPTSWSVFDPAGGWLGDVSMPAGLQVYEIGEDYLTGTRRVEGVTQVVVYRLISG